MNKIIKHGLIWSLLDKIINQIIYFFILIYIGKVIGPSAFGLIGIASVFIALTESLVNYGFSQALIQKNNINPIEKSTIFFSSLVFSTILYLIFFFSSGEISEYYELPDLKNIICVLLIVIIFNSINVVPRSILLIEFKYNLIAISNCIATIISAIAAILLLNEGFSFWAFVYFNLLRTAINTTFNFIFSKWVPSLSFSLDSLKYFARYSIFLSLSGILSAFVNNAYILFIGKYLNTFNVGLFTQSNNISSMLSGVLTSIIQNIAFPILSKSKKNHKQFESDLISILKSNMLISLPVLVGFCLVSKEFTYIFLDDNWGEIIPILNIFAISKIFTSLSIVNINTMNAVGRSDLFFLSDLIKTPIIFIGIFISIEHGLYYLSLSFLITSVISYIITVIFSNHVVKFSLQTQLSHILPFVISTIIMYFIVREIHIEDNLKSLLIKIFIGAISYFTTLILILASINKWKKTSYDE
ncbi:oligosaccharide flippase family protein [Providencia alcalifaciens]|uniref:oligosaccharide flippase family protein n=1 Tax=Providencia alcalifaciens TaxID=126385 RepID=UPI00029BAAC9|nr:oligosaccharide flippase family protein [Providencia alcalifaciens]EKT63113.1 polysaccharide biosynthesis protein [Providencia alcalifaciens Dmel2]